MNYSRSQSCWTSKPSVYSPVYLRFHEVITEQEDVVVPPIFWFIYACINIRYNPKLCWSWNLNMQTESFCYQPFLTEASEGNHRARRGLSELFAAVAWSGHAVTAFGASNTIIISTGDLSIFCASRFSASATSLRELERLIHPSAAVVWLRLPMGITEQGEAYPNFCGSCMIWTCSHCFWGFQYYHNFHGWSFNLLRQSVLSFCYQSARVGWSSLYVACSFCFHVRLAMFKHTHVRTPHWKINLAPQESY